VAHPLSKTPCCEPRQVQRDNQDGSGASIWMRRGRRACNAGRA